MKTSRARIGSRRLRTSCGGADHGRRILGAVRGYFTPDHLIRQNSRMAATDSKPFSVTEIEQELGRGRLAFAHPQMEREFRSDFLHQVPYARRNVLLLPLLILGLGPLYGSGLFGVPPEFSATAHILEFGVIIPVLLMALLSTLLAPLQRWSDALTQAAMIVLVAGLALLADLNGQSGFSLPRTLAAAAMVGFLMLARLPFRRAIAAALVALVLMGLTKFLLLRPGASARFDYFSDLVFFGIGTIAAYRYETSMRRSWLQQRLLESLVQNDGLTGVLNRRGFDLAIERMLKQSQREAKSLTLMLVDVDHFKAINDRHGHPYGDECLRRVAALLSGCIRRPLDLCARLGGEEFVLVWYDTSPEDALRLTASAIAAVSAAAIPHEASPVGPVVTISGGAVFIKPGEVRRLRELIRQADALLYRAKVEGRNRQHFAEFVIPESELGLQPLGASS